VCLGLSHPSVTRSVAVCAHASTVPIRPQKLHDVGDLGGLLGQRVYVAVPQKSFTGTRISANEPWTIQRATNTNQDAAYWSICYTIVRAARECLPFRPPHHRDGWGVPHDFGRGVASDWHAELLNWCILSRSTDRRCVDKRVNCQRPDANGMKTLLRLESFVASDHLARRLDQTVNNTITVD
jgi:hypothetical protein